MKRLIQQLRAAFENLAPRERVLLGAVGLMVIVTALWFGLVNPVLAMGADTRARVETAEQQLEVVRRLRAEYDEVSGRLQAVEERIASGRRGNLRTTLESLAQRAAVKIESMEPQSSPAHTRYRETKVEVGLKQVTLPQTVRYLHEIEATPQALTVKKLRLRTRNDDPSLLDVTFTVSSFEPL